MKTTQELINEIKSAPSLREFLEDSAEDITEPRLTEYLDNLLAQKGISRTEAIRRGDLSANYAYQIFSGRKNPSRDKLIRLSVGMGLNLDETARLFKLAGVSEFYPRVKRDAVIMFCIERSVQVMDIDLLLDELNLYTLA